MVIDYYPVHGDYRGIITAWLAVRSDDGLVADDYYKRGLEINKILARDQAARNYELNAQVTAVRDRKILQLILHGNERFRSPASLVLTFLHPTRGGQDRHVISRIVSGMIYEAELPELPAANWHLLIEADDWRFTAGSVNCCGTLPYNAMLGPAEIIQLFRYVLHTRWRLIWKPEQLVRITIPANFNNLPVRRWLTE